jgi:hypothetical protein
VLSFDPTRLRELHGLWLVGVAQLQSLEFLGALTNLEYLDIFIHAAADPSALGIPETIPIPSLRTLHIGTYPGFDPDLFLKPLKIPNLCHLVISSFPQAGISIAPVFSALFEGKGSLRLHTLCITGYDITLQDYLPWSHILEELHTLEFGHSTAHPGIFRALSTVIPNGHGSRWLCPKLTSLILDHCLIPSWPDFLRFIRTRTSLMPTGTGSEHAAILRKITLRNCYEGPMQSLPLQNSHKVELEGLREAADHRFELDFGEES